MVGDDTGSRELVRHSHCILETSLKECTKVLNDADFSGQCTDNDRARSLLNTMESVVVSLSTISVRLRNGAALSLPEIESVIENVAKQRDKIDRLLKKISSFQKNSQKKNVRRTLILSIIGDPLKSAGKGLTIKLGKVANYFIVAFFVIILTAALYGWARIMGVEFPSIPTKWIQKVLK